MPPSRIFYEKQWDPRVHPDPEYYLRREPFLTMFHQRQEHQGSRAHSTRDTNYVQNWLEDLVDKLVDDSVVDWVSIVAFLELFLCSKLQSSMKSPKIFLHTVLELHCPQSRISRFSLKPSGLNWMRAMRRLF